MYPVYVKGEKTREGYLLVYKYVVENFTNQSVQVQGTSRQQSSGCVEFYAVPAASIDNPTNLTNPIWSVLNAKDGKRFDIKK